MSTRFEAMKNLEDIFDSVDEAVSIASAIRDRDGRILDFRIEFLNVAAARWAGLERTAMVGLLAGDILPGLRASGLFEDLCGLVGSGEPLSRAHLRYRDVVAGGNTIDGIYDLRAVRIGDGYINTWRPSAGSSKLA
jgi:hypothetical protein